MSVDYNKISDQYYRKIAHFSPANKKEIAQRHIESTESVATPLDKLAQLRKGQQNQGVQSSIKSLEKKNNRKYFTKILARNLKNLVTETQDFDFYGKEIKSKHRNGLKDYYERAYNCNDQLFQQGQTLTSSYCNTRICTVCNNVRTAKLINAYEKEFEKFKEPYLVTLTVPNCSANLLPGTIRNMYSSFRKIKDKWRKKSELSYKNVELTRDREESEIGDFFVKYLFGEISESYFKKYEYRLTAKEFRDKIEKSGIQIIRPLTGIRKIEVTYNLKKRNFHPHFHLIVDTKDAAEFIKNEWLFYNPDANVQAQDARKADKNSLLEIFKYTTKVIASTKLNGKNTRKIELYALHTIIKSTYGMRTFQTYGDITKHSEDVEKIQGQHYDNLDDIGEGLVVWFYDSNVNTWVNSFTGELLTAYKPKNYLIELFSELGRDRKFLSNRLKLQKHIKKTVYERLKFDYNRPEPSARAAYKDLGDIHKVMI